MTRSTSINKFSDFIEHNHTLTVICNSCYFTKKLDLEKMIAKHGDLNFDQSRALLPKFKCQRCDKNNAGYQVSSGHDQPMGYADKRT